MTTTLNSWEIMLIETLVRKARRSDREGFANLCADNPGVCDNYSELLDTLSDKLLAATELRVSKRLPD